MPSGFPSRSRGLVVLAMMLAQQVRRDPLADAGLPDRLPQGSTDGPATDRPVHSCPGEQLRPRRPGRPPVLAEHAEELSRQHDVAVAPLLGVADVNQPALAVDVTDAQPARLGDAQPGTIRRHQDGPMPERGNVPKDRLQLGASEDIRQLVRLSRPDDPGDHLRLSEGDRVQEPDCPQVALDGPRRQLPLVLQEELVAAHLVGPHLDGRPHEVRNEPLRVPQVQLPRPAPVAAQPQVFLHPIANVTHVVLLAPADGR